MTSTGACSVAAIVPLHNNRDTVVEAIHSVLSQTRRVQEIVIVDDGSTDGSAELVERVFGESVRVFRQENRGPAAARNTAIRNSRCDLIAFLDADDRWLPERVKTQAAFMESDPECHFCFSAHLEWSEKHNATRAFNTSINHRTFLRKQFFRGQCFISTDSIMIRRRILEEVGLFDESLQVGEDSDLWLRIMLRCGFGHIPEPLVWMRRSLQRWERITRDIDHHFAMSTQLYAKHRYAFGRGLRGWLIWHGGRGFILRYQALQFLNVGRRGRAFTILLHGIVTWPFVAPMFTLRCVGRLCLGDSLYRTLSVASQPCKSVVKRMLSLGWRQGRRECNSTKNYDASQ